MRTAITSLLALTVMLACDTEVPTQPKSAPADRVAVDVGYADFVTEIPLGIVGVFKIPPARGFEYTAKFSNDRMTVRRAFEPAVPWPPGNGAWEVASANLCVLKDYQDKSWSQARQSYADCIERMLDEDWETPDDPEDIYAVASLPQLNRETGKWDLHSCFICLH